jgi:ribA/ribD-fused uncharacterized protein
MEPNEPAEQPVPIIFYSKSKDPRARVLSNFSASDVTFERGGVAFHFPSVEHAFQAGKWSLCDVAWAAQFEVGGVVGKMTAEQAKAEGNRKAFAERGCTLPTGRWESIRDAVMEEAVRARLANDERFREVLRESGDAHLLHFERSGAKSHWGGYKSKTSGEMFGENVLGLLLMRLREELRAAEAPPQGGGAGAP